MSQYIAIIFTDIFSFYPHAYPPIAISGHNYVRCLAVISNNKSLTLAEKPVTYDIWPRKSLLPSHVTDIFLNIYTLDIS